MSAEEWRAVVGFEGLYEVSNLGRVRSLGHSVLDSTGKIQYKVGQIRKPQTNRGGYAVVGLHRAGSKTVLTTVHKMVALAFIGPRPLNHEVCHGDGDRKNNSATNLRWGTGSENAADRTAHGRSSNHRRDSCRKGHPFNEANTYVLPNGVGRQCRECSNARSRARNERNRAKRT